MTSYSPIDDERASQANLLDKNVPQILSIDVDAVLKKHYTPFMKWPNWFQRFVSWLLRLIIRQDRINKFLSENSLKLILDTK